MSALSYIDDQLHIEQVDLNELAEKFGSPTYIYSRAALEQAYLNYRNALDSYGPNRHLICFAVKANSNLGVLSVLAKLGCGFDIVSVGELERVLLAGGDPKKIVFSGVAKMKHEIQRALEVGIHCFNVESESELNRIATIASHLKVIAPISIRVNPDVDAQTHPYISTGLKENKFGIDIDDSLRIYQHAEQHPALRVIGVDCHIGSQLTTLEPFNDALTRVLSLVDQLANVGIVLEHIDIGGGLGVTYRDEQPPSHAEYIQQLMQLLQGRQQSLVIEPGRSIAANAGVLLCRVDTIKTNGDKHFAIVDAAMNDMIRPALYEAWLDIQPVNTNTSSEKKTYDVVGPVCETSDFIGKDRSLSLSEGDLLCVKSAGAYGFVMSSNYNGRCRAAEIIVDGKNYHTVREREKIADLVRGEYKI